MVAELQLRIFTFEKLRKCRPQVADLKLRIAGKSQSRNCRCGATFFKFTELRSWTTTKLRVPTIIIMYVLIRIYDL